MLFKEIIYFQSLHGSNVGLPPVISFAALCLLMAALSDDGDRVRCDPCLSVGDLEACFMVYFSRTQRNLQPLLDGFAQETWKTAPKALMGFFFRYFFRSFLYSHCVFAKVCHCVFTKYSHCVFTKVCLYNLCVA